MVCNNNSIKTGYIGINECFSATHRTFYTENTIKSIFSPGQNYFSHFAVRCPVEETRAFSTQGKWLFSYIFSIQLLLPKRGCPNQEIGIFQNLQMSPISQISFLVGTFFAISYSKPDLASKMGQIKK